MMDKLILHNLALQCRIGVTEQERAAAQSVWVDLELPIDAAKAAAWNSLRGTIDYATLAERVAGLAQSRPFVLMETLAEQIADCVLTHGRPAWVTVRVRKRALAGLDYASIEITRPCSARK